MSSRNILLFSILSLLSSCSAFVPTGNGPVTVDVRKALRKTPKNSELFDDIRCIDIEEPAGKRVCVKSRVAVSDGNFILKDSTGTSLLVFNSKGDYLDEMKFNDTILDFSDFEDKYIDVLAGNRLYVYDANRLKLEKIYDLPQNDVKLISFARRQEDVFQLSGFNGESDFFVEFYVKEKKCYYVPNPIPLPKSVREESIPNSYFFKDGKETKFFYSHSGDVWYIGTFSSPRFRWNLEGIPEDAEYHFTNAQGCSRKVYLTMVMNGEPYTMIYNPDTGKSFVLSKTKEKSRLPVGVIKNNKNYFLCPADQVPDYVGKYPVQCDSKGLVMLEYSLSL